MFEIVAITGIVVVVLALLPARHLAVMLGILLPVDYVQGVDPGLFQYARYGLVILILLKSRPEDHPRTPTAKIVLIALAVVGLFTAIAGLVGGSTTEALSGVIGAGSVVAAFLLARRSQLRGPVLAGFVVGTLASALDIISQASGGPFMGMPTIYGIRYSGLSYSSTAISPLMAIALILVLTSRTGSWHPFLVFIRVIAQLSAVLVLGAAMLLSGGRAGMLGLALALMVLGIANLRRHPVAVLAGAFASMVCVYLAWPSLQHVLFRADDNSGFASGRVDLNTQGWTAFLNSPLFGVDPRSAALLEPHTPLISFAVQAGVLGLLCACILVAIQFRIILSNPLSASPVMTPTRMICAVMIVSSFLEPNGFFVGLTRILLFMFVVFDFDVCKEWPATGRSLLGRNTRTPDTSGLARLRRLDETGTGDLA